MLDAIQAVDRGKDFGNFGADARRFFFDEVPEQLAPLCARLSFADETPLFIGDWGAGNGILSRALAQHLTHPYQRIFG